MSCQMWIRGTDVKFVALKIVAVTYALAVIDAILNQGLRAGKSQQEFKAKKNQ